MQYEITPSDFNSTPEELSEQAHHLCLDPVIKKNKVILNSGKNCNIDINSRLSLFWCLGLKHQIEKG